MLRQFSRCNSLSDNYYAITQHLRCNSTSRTKQKLYNKDNDMKRRVDNEIKNGALLYFIINSFSMIMKRMFTLK